MIYFQNTLPQHDVTPFEVKGISVQLQNSEITHPNTYNTAKVKHSQKPKMRNKLEFWKVTKTIEKGNEIWKVKMTGKQDHKMIKKYLSKKANINKFHKSVQYIVSQCTVCTEA